MTKQLTLEELGDLQPCEKCGRLSYDRNKLPEETVQLPDFFTTGDERRFVTMQGRRYRLCANCRYDAPFNRY